MLNFIFFWKKLKSVHKLCILKKEKGLTSVKPCHTWWRIPESNRWPLACQASALASWANPPNQYFLFATFYRQLTLTIFLFPLLKFCYHILQYELFSKEYTVLYFLYWLYCALTIVSQHQHNTFVTITIKNVCIIQCITL